MDTAVQKAAEEAADEMAREFAEQFGFTFRLIRRVLMSKAENDPDWFLEKSQEWDINILDEFMKPSKSKQREMEQSGPEVDMEVDDALERTLDKGPPEEQDHEDIFDDEGEPMTPQNEEQPEGVEDLFDEETVAPGGEQ